MTQTGERREHQRLKIRTGTRTHQSWDESDPSSISTENGLCYSIGRLATPLLFVGRCCCSSIQCHTLLSLLELLRQRIEQLIRKAHVCRTDRQIQEACAANLDVHQRHVLGIDQTGSSNGFVGCREEQAGVSQSLPMLQTGEKDPNVLEGMASTVWIEHCTMRAENSSSEWMALGFTLAFFSHWHVFQRAPKSCVVIGHGSSGRPLY